MGRACFPKGRPDGRVPQFLLRPSVLGEMLREDPEETDSEAVSTVIRFEDTAVNHEAHLYAKKLRVSWREPHHHAGRKLSGKKRRQWRHDKARKLRCAREYGHTF